MAGPRPTGAVARPVPQAQQDDPRAFQISQLERRFKPTRAQEDGTTVLKFNMKPSDPDFPYEIDELKCVLKVPADYPLNEKPHLEVTNYDIPRGFQINIERGFKTIAANAPQATLLNLMNRLDRELEGILAGKVAETVKVVVPTHPKERRAEPMQVQPTVSVAQPTTTKSSDYSAEQLEAAKAKRKAHARQLEARLGKVPGFHKSNDGLVYTIPLDSPKRSSWPAPLQLLQTFELLVGDRYPLIPASIRLVNESEEARRVETAFQKHLELSAMTLTQAINYLSQNINSLAVIQTSSVEKPQPASTAALQPPPPTNIAIPSKPQGLFRLPDDRPHIHVIPRPPEWSKSAQENSESDTDDSQTEDSEYDEADGNEDAAKEQDSTLPSLQPAERGVLLSFPHIELYGIELLELTSLSVTVKCERCKDLLDVSKLRNSGGEESKMRKEACKKCAATLAVGFRADLMHEHSARAGYLDLEGCAVVDMLPRYICRASVSFHRSCIADIHVVTSCLLVLSARRHT